jgi:3-methyladenine DNA glycosylase AlkD
MSEKWLTDKLISLADSSYKIFSERLIKQGKPILGVRMGPLRKLAQELVRDPAWTFNLLGNPKNDQYHEEKMIRALTIAYAKIDEHNRIQLVEEFSYYIDNWAICDSFASTLKQARTHEELYRDLIVRTISSEYLYPVRLSIVIMLNYFMQEKWLAENLLLLEQVQTDHYYVKMAVAWAIATAYVVSPETVRPWMETSLADSETYRMAAQKIRDSRRT